MRQPTRREVLGGIATTTAAGIGYHVSTNGARATTELNIQKFSIPDESAEVVDPVAGVTLNVDAQYKIDAEKLPTRVVLRLEGKRSGNYTQLKATELAGLQKSMSGTKQLTGNLLDLPNLEAMELSPQNRDETETVDLSIRLQMTVKRDGVTLSETTVEDMVTINVSKGTASANIQLGGDGSVSVIES